MKKIAIALIIATLAIVSACETTPIAKVESGNKQDRDVEVAIVAHFNGVTLYRVYVDGHNVYVADRGDNGPQRTEYTVPSGKHQVPEGVIVATAEAK